MPMHRAASNHARSPCAPFPMAAIPQTRSLQNSDRDGPSRSSCAIPGRVDRHQKASTLPPGPRARRKRCSMTASPGPGWAAPPTPCPMPNTRKSAPSQAPLCADVGRAFVSGSRRGNAVGPVYRALAQRGQRHGRDPFVVVGFRCESRPRQHEYATSANRRRPLHRAQGAMGMPSGAARQRQRARRRRAPRKPGDAGNPIRVGSRARPACAVGERGRHLRFFAQLHAIDDRDPTRIGSKCRAKPRSMTVHELPNPMKSSNPNVRQQRMMSWNCPRSPRPKSQSMNLLARFSCTCGVKPSIPSIIGTIASARAPGGRCGRSCPIR